MALKPTKYEGGSWLKDALEHRGRSQSALGRALGLPPSAINRMVNGNRAISAEEMAEIERFLWGDLPHTSLIDTAEREASKEGDAASEEDAHSFIEALYAQALQQIRAGIARRLKPDAATKIATEAKFQKILDTAVLLNVMTEEEAETFKSIERWRHALKSGEATPSDENAWLRATLGRFAEGTLGMSLNASDEELNDNSLLRAVVSLWVSTTALAMRAENRQAGAKVLWSFLRHFASEHPNANLREAPTRE